MLPKFKPGDLVFVHPHRKARVGDCIVIQEPDTANGQPQAFIKELAGVTAKLLRTRQFYPKAEIDFVIRPGLVWHRVMETNDLYGI